MSGFGQREGLEISEKFKLLFEDVNKFESFARSYGWQPLPIPAEQTQKSFIEG
jgi:hypothetical protein